MHDTKLLAIAEQIAFFGIQAALKLLWSDEMKLILGSTMFYPMFAMSAIFLASRISPVRVVNKCACFCNRKLKAIWMRVQIILRRIQAQKTVLIIRRNHLLTSVKFLVGAAEILIF